MTGDLPAEGNLTAAEAPSHDLERSASELFAQANWSGPPVDLDEPAATVLAWLHMTPRLAK
jgi:hypothetical protein